MFKDKRGFHVNTGKSPAAYVVALSALLMASGCAAPPKVFDVVIICGSDFTVNTANVFKSRMTELGYQEGGNIIYDLQKTEYGPAARRLVFSQFISANVDLIVAFHTEIALEAKAAVKGTTIPVLFANANIEGVDLVDSVRAPGGNITGVRYPGPDIAIKRFEIMRELAPRAKRMWVPYQRNYPIVFSELAALRPAAAAAGVALIEFPADNPAQLRAELEKRSRAGDLGFDAVLCIPEVLSVTPQTFELIAGFTRKRKIPIGGPAIVTKDYGTLFSLGVDYAEEARLVAYMADKILKGVPAGSIPVVSDEPYLKINIKVAAELGLPVSEALAGKANEVIR